MHADEDEAFDEYAAKQLNRRMSDRPDPKKLKTAANRYAGLRCRPPGLSPPAEGGDGNGPGQGGSGPGDDDKSKKEKFKNTGKCHNYEGHRTCMCA